MTTSERDDGAREQTRVRLGALVATAVAGLAAVVALGLGAYLWALGLAVFAVAASFWAWRMYTDLADYRRQELAQHSRRAAVAGPASDDPYAGPRPLGG
jgi:hypothetical protein